MSARVRGLAAALALAGPARAEHRMAIVIGANRGDIEEVPLRFAEDDARRVADVLTTLGGVSPIDLIRLDAPRADDVRSALAAARSRLQADDRAVLLVYYSGHADAFSLHLGGTRLPLAEVQRAVEDAPASARILVLDACRTGELTRAKGGTPVEPFAIVIDHSAATGTAVLTAAAAGEDAQESDRLEGGVFTHHLIAGMRGAADTTGDRRVSLGEAYRYAYDRTVATTASAPVMQHPAFAWDLQGRDEVVLTWLDPTSRAGRLQFSEDGEYVLLDATGRTVQLELAVSAGGSVAVDTGTYLVRRRGLNTLWEGVVRVDGGETTSLGPGDLTQVPMGQATRRGSAVRSAFSMHLGGGVEGPLADGLGALPYGDLGVRLDVANISLTGDVVAGHRDASFNQIEVSHTVVGGRIGALYMGDVGPVSLGAGVRVGMDGAMQSFDTDGEAPPKTAISGRLGPMVRAEVAVHPRVSLGLQSGFDAVFLPSHDASRDVETRIVPHGVFDVSFWLF